MKIVNRLIFDVGLHKGEDTAYYLAKGFDVVAFEANPSLIAHCEIRFASEIAEGRLTMIPGAISSTRGKITFFQTDRSVWGTTSEDWARRNELAGVKNTALEVDSVDIADAFSRFGIPYYIKIDVEGADRVVLDAIGALPERPYYLSIESEKVDFEALKAELAVLYGLGYRKFRPVQQANIRGRTIKTKTVGGSLMRYSFEKDSSGAFGEDVGPWLTLSDCIDAYRGIFLLYGLFGDNSTVMKIKGANFALQALGKLIRAPLPGWYDTHAAL